MDGSEPHHVAGAHHTRQIVTPRVATVLWVLAIGTYGVGDLATTLYFIFTTPVVEGHPIAGPVAESVGHWILVPWKALAIGLFYALYRVVPSPYRIGIPIGLVVLGSGLTAWNSYLSLVVV